MEEKEKIRTGLGSLTISEAELNSLFKEVLDGVRDDLKEAQQNAEMYLDAIINESGGKEAYGPGYNKALEIKGQIRSRQLQLVNMVKDRVGKKEQMKLVTDSKGGAGIGFDNYELNKFIDDIENKKKFTTTPKISAPIDDEDEEPEDLEMDDDDDDDLQ